MIARFHATFFSDVIFQVGGYMLPFISVGAVVVALSFILAASLPSTSRFVV